MFTHRCIYNTWPLIWKLTPSSTQVKVIIEFLLEWNIMYQMILRTFCHKIIFYQICLKCSGRIGLNYFIQSEKQTQTKNKQVKYFLNSLLGILKMQKGRGKAMKSDNGRFQLSNPNVEFAPLQMRELSTSAPQNLERTSV